MSERAWLIGVVVVVVLAAACGGQPLPSPPATNTAVGPTEAPATTPSAAGSDEPSNVASGQPSGSVARAADIFLAMTQVIAAHRPNFRFQLEPSRLDGELILDGNANDGFGEGRLYIVVIGEAGALTGHPCGDRDFTQGGPCVERFMANGDLLVLRDIVQARGTKTIEVVVIHPDRSGISLEATNFAIDLHPGPLTQEQMREPPTITRPDPLYTTLDLAELAIAIEARIQECEAGTC